MTDTNKNKKSEFNILNESLYEINRFTLKAFGSWPYQSRFKRGALSFMALFGVFTVVIPEIIFFFENIKKNDVNKIVDCIPNLIITYGAYVMIFNSVINFHKMRKTLFKIKDDWIAIKEVEEVKILERYAKEGKLLILIYLMATVSTLVFFCLEPLLPFALDLVFPLNESRPVRTILEVQYYVDLRKYYVPIYFHNLQAAYFVIFTVLTYDFYFVMVIQHACSMFKILGYRIANTDRKNLKMGNWIPGSKQNKFITDNVASCVNYHLECIDFAELIEDTFTVSWILQLTLNVVLISCIGVQTITRTNDPMSLMKYAMTTLSVIVRLFYISWPGQKIVDHSSQIYDDVYNIPWYNFPDPTKRLLILMLLRSSRPCYISAGNMIYLNFDTYATLMKTSGSYFTMILSTQ